MTAEEKRTEIFNNLPVPEIIYENDEIIVVNKPCFIPVHSSGQHKTTETCMHWVRDFLGHYVYPLHRLDNQTTGNLFFAKSNECVAKRMEWFSSENTQKLYLTVCRGWIKQETCIDRELKHPDSGKMQEARTVVHPLLQTEIPVPTQIHKTTRVTVLAVRPTTGRTHQIRRHLRGINHPILGDTRHGHSRLNIALGEYLGYRRLYLHALYTRIKETPPKEEEATQKKILLAKPDKAFNDFLSYLSCDFDEIKKQALKHL